MRKRSRKSEDGSAAPAAETSAPEPGTTNASAPSTPTAAPAAAAPQPTSKDEQITFLKEALGISSLQRRLELIEASHAVSVPEMSDGPPQGAPPNPMNTLIAMLLPEIPNIVKGLTGRLLGGGGGGEEDEEFNAIKEIQRRIRQEERRKMNLVLDRMVSGAGLLIEEPTEEPKDIGKPDGGKVQ